MAWSEESWRYSHAKLPNPAQSEDELQFHLSLVGAPVSSNTLATQYAWTNTDRLALLHIPDPANNLAVIARSALAEAPLIGANDSIDRDGALSVALGGFVADLDGTNVIPAFDGSLTTTIGGFSASLVGDVIYRHFFDISYAVTPTWVVTELPANFGDVDVTLGGFTASLTGFSLPPDSTQGRIDITLGGFVSDLDGTVALPPSFDGNIGVDIASFSASLSGSSVPAGGVVGSLPVTLGGFTAALSGTSASFSADGQIGVALSGFGAGFQGQFIDASANNGLVSGNLGGFSVIFRGEYTPGAGFDTAIIHFEGDATATVQFDEDSEALWLSQ